MTTTERPDDGTPFDAAGLARHMAKRGLHRLLVCHLLRTVLRLGFSASAALVVGGLVMQQPFAPWLPLVAVGMLVLASAAGLIGDRLQASAETAVAAKLRIVAALRLGRMPARRLQALPAGELVSGMQRHPQSIAALVVGHRAASMMMAAGPLTVAAMLGIVSWQAAVLVLCLTPVMIVFFALVGDAIRRRAEMQERAFGRLAGQFADRIRTLPTILANHGLEAEEEKLAGRLQTYAGNTMGVLRVAFVNAGIIDFFSSLSIAMLAVFLGLGHLKLAMIPGFSSLELWQSLFILMAAPDYFAPFRRFSEQYHAKAEGQAAATAMDRLMDGVPAAAPMLPDIDRLAASLPAGGLVAVVGPSGSGKSTLLRRIAGVDEAPADAARSWVAWISTDSFVPEGTLGDAIAWNTGITCPTRLNLAAKGVGLLDESLLPGGLGARIAPGGANLSGGQRLRLAIARAALTGRAVIADEPTAKLDRETAASIRALLAELSRSRLVVVATHDRALSAQAGQIIDLSSSGKAGVAA